MHPDFIKVKPLHGELILSQVKDQLGISVTTKELYFQKPHHSYHILFEDIVSIIPFQTQRKQTTINIARELKVHSSFSSQLYKIRTLELLVINRNGRFRQMDAEIILPLAERFLEKVQLYSDLTFLPAK